MIKHFFSYEWNLFGDYRGIQFARRLEYINGKPMVYVTYIYFIYLFINRFIIFIPNSENILGYWWYKYLSIIIHGLFWILFIDGILVKFLKGYTKGEYYLPYIVRKYKYSKYNIENEIKKEIRWANFIFKHPEFCYDLERLDIDSRRYANQTVTKIRRRDRYVFMQSVSHNMEQNLKMHLTNYEEYEAPSGNSYSDYYNKGFERLIDRYQVYIDKKGRYYSLLDKKRIFRYFIGVIAAYSLCVCMIVVHIGAVGLGVWGINYGIDYLGERLETVDFEEVISNSKKSLNNNLVETEGIESEENQLPGQNVNFPIEELGQDVQEYKDCIFQIASVIAHIYIYPTDYGHMYEATQGAQFVATGMEFVGEDGVLWYEFYTNSEKTNKAWVKATEIQFQ